MGSQPILGAHSKELQASLYPQPLKPRQIRLLSFSFFESDFLHCSVDFVAEPSPAKEVVYDALSYVWGNQRSDLQPIRCNGQNLFVTKNLRDALGAVWSSNPHVLIWADALCINQSDDEEKSEQVARMHHVYSDAACVRVWLGDMSRAVTKMLPHLTEYDTMEIKDSVGNQPYLGWGCHCIDHKGRRWELCLSRRPNSLDSESSVSRMWSDVLHGLNDILSREWFERAWTMQEAILARRAVLHIGAQTMDWDDFRRRISKSDGSGLQIRNYLVHEVFAAHEAIQKREYSLSQFLLLSWPRKAYDPRDKVFSLLGLLPDQLFKVDYSRSTRDVYIAATRACISVDKNLRVLSAAGLTKKQAMGLSENEVKCSHAEYCPADEAKCDCESCDCEPSEIEDKSLLCGLPSWVPDWRAAGCRESIDQTDWYMTVRKDGSLHVGEAVTVQPQDDLSRCLLLRGSVLGQFRASTPFKDNSPGAQNGKPDMKSVVGTFVEFPSCTRKALSGTAAPGGMANPTTKVIDQLSHLSQFSLAVQQHDQNECGCSEQNLQLPLECRPILSVVGGSLPTYCTDGDWLCILDGAAAPSILRLQMSNQALLSQDEKSLQQCQYQESRAFIFVGSMKNDFYGGQDDYLDLFEARNNRLGTYVDHSGRARVENKSRVVKELREATARGEQDAYMQKRNKVIMKQFRTVQHVDGMFHLH